MEERFKIIKFCLEITKLQIIDIPYNSKILSIRWGNDNVIELFALCDCSQEKKEWVFLLFSTDEIIDSDGENGDNPMDFEFIGTVKDFRPIEQPDYHLFLV